MRNTNRLIALALCCTLTLGAFVYKPPEAKAIAGVDDAVVIGALLSAFAGGCGLIFSNNGMSSNEIAQGLTAKWNDFKETLASVPADFPAWLGYDSMDALITDLRWDEVKDVLSIPRTVARKLSDFTDWLTSDVGVAPDSGSKTVVHGDTGHSVFLSDGSEVSLTELHLDSSGEVSFYDASFGTMLFSFSELSGTSRDNPLTYVFSDGSSLSVYALDTGLYYRGSASGSNWHPFNYAKFTGANSDAHFFLCYISSDIVNAYSGMSYSHGRAGAPLAERIPESEVHY